VINLARPKKDGLEYFPLDVSAGIDDEIELLEAEYGLEGFSIFIKLLQKIYKNNYYLEWTDKEQLQFSKRVNTDAEKVNLIISSCLKWGLLNSKLFEHYNILTSHGIQERFLLAIGRRTSYKIYKEYLLMTDEEMKPYKNIVLLTKTLVNVSKTPFNVDINPQSKVKEIESKVNREEIESSNNTAAIQQKLEHCFGRLISPYELDEICSYLKNNIQLELIEKSIEVAADKGVRDIKYIKKILDRCLEKNILTLEQYEIDQQDFINKIKNKSSSQNQESEPTTDAMKKFLEGG
jgi:DnaD/phage-associated family protein